MENKPRKLYSESFKKEKVEQLESGMVRLVDLNEDVRRELSDLVQLEEEVWLITSQRLCRVRKG